MAIVLEIDNGDNLGRVNYTRYLASPDRSPAVLRDRINLPALLDFSLAPADDRFIPPRRGAYVRLTGLVNSLPPGGPRVPGPLFSGYITSEPVVEYLGVIHGPAHGYRCQATSEEYLLNVKRIGVLPPFLNQTAGAILQFLVGHLQPGRFSVDSVADGTLIPYYLPRPDQSWSEVARELADQAGFFYRVLDGAILFQQLGSEPSGVSVDEGERHFRPEALAITPLGNPILNDVVIVGEIEPQAYVTEHFAGDGFTSRFALAAPVFGVKSARLLADDFTGAAVDSLLWQETDPNGVISLFDARLNVTGGTGTLGETTLLARQAIELGGELELLHGEFEFVGASSGVIGGFYSSAALGLSDCLMGFEVSPISNTTRVRVVVSGAVLAPEVVVQPNHHYILTTRLSGDQPFRTLQTFLSLGASYGGLAIASNVRITLEVRDIDLANAGAQIATVLHESTLSNLPAFGFYAPINAADLHVVANFLQVTRPIQANLVTEKQGQTELQRSLGFGIAAHDATITADPNRNQWALEFYEDTVPALGEKIVLSYRAAGRAAARVVDPASIAAEATLAGDDGARAVVLSEVSPMPRTSAEAELAAQAYLSDHSGPRFEGQYTTWSRLADGWPRTGARLTVNNPARYPQFTALVRGVTSEFRELAGEEVLHTIEFGKPSRFEDLLRHFAPAPNVLDTRDEISLEPVATDEIGLTFIADVPGARLAGVTPTAIELDMGVPPPSGGSYVVRRSDQGWSNGSMPGTAQNLIGAFTSQTIPLPRAGGVQVFFVRPVAATGETSRFSAAVGVHYPLPPAPPQEVRVRFGASEENKPIIAVTVVLDANDTTDVNTVELRDEDNATVPARWDFGQLRWEEGSYTGDLVLDNSTALARAKTFFGYTINTLGEYSPSRSGAGSMLEPTKPFLFVGHSIGQVLEILLDKYPGQIVETQVQAIGPAGDFSAPVQDILLEGQPQKFNFVATQSGAWGFRARRRDLLGWSPWSTDSQGQIPAQFLVIFVEFFQAHELDPSIGAAVNGQNLLPNGEFFLGGIAGQEGVHAARYFALANAAADGSEVDHSLATNEMQWKPGVSFASANPGFRSLLSNLGRLCNPGESVTLSAALRHTGTGLFSHAVRMALRSAASPGYDQSQDIAASQLTNDYRWYSVAFTLAAGQAVPGDLAAEITVVAATGQALGADLFCDKVILNRGHRPAAFSLAPWDVVALSWNASAGAFDLPATVAGGTPRSSDPGNAGRLSGTGTEDLDPDFTDRYLRLTA